MIDELMRQGAHRMLVETVLVEVDAYIARFREELDEHGTGWWSITTTTNRGR